MAEQTLQAQSASVENERRTFQEKRPRTETQRGLSRGEGPILDVVRERFPGQVTQGFTLTSRDRGHR